MIDLETIKLLSQKYQTRIDNIIREYFQHLFLSLLYSQKESEDIYFKGGTALKIIYHSPRFSEDLDFSASKNISLSQIDDLFLETLKKMNEVGAKVNLEEAKRTSGGYFGIFSYELHGFLGKIQLEISLRKKSNLQQEVTTIVSDFLPAYILIQLSPRLIVEEKMLALEIRHKPRDFYDLYFILRHPELNKYLDFKKIKTIKEILLKEKINFKKELEILLPVSHHLLLNNFKETLLKEIEKQEVE